MLSFSIVIAIYAGFIHAFEADHLLAVSNIVSQRNSVTSSLKDGLFWGFGHSSTIIAVGILMLLFKVAISTQMFHYFEALVGIMLIVLAIYRLIKFIRQRGTVVHTHTHNDNQCFHLHNSKEAGQRSKHSLAYGIGLVHGLAGSGALILIVMAQSTSTLNALTYLLIFCLGCIAGMFVASGLFSIPFSKKIMQAKILQVAFICISSMLCLLYGGKAIYENLAH